jgi:hypothetical protein
MAAVVASTFALTLGAVISAQSGAIQIPKPPIAPAAGWTPPKTAWGDPDISGILTNKYEQGTPMERPAGFEGRGLDEVRGAELKKLLADRQRQSDERQQFPAGDRSRAPPASGIHDRGEIVKGTSRLMIIDPGDGRPAMTGGGSVAGRGADPGTHLGLISSELVRAASDAAAMLKKASRRNECDAPMR